MEGIWLPIITPLKDDAIDLKSYKRMIHHYIDQGISGLIPLGTTGESPTLLPQEKALLLHATMEYVDGRIPVVWGHGGNATKALIKELPTLEASGIHGILSVSPYYNRPSQEGIYQHFKAISEATDLDIILYNIPYRTGRNMTNETIYRLAELDNIIALKDACGDFAQTNDLLMNKPCGFDVLSGEDAMLFAALASGASGSICASAHLRTADFVRLVTLMAKSDLTSARALWQELYPMVVKLFGEPNPAPIKYVLHKKGLIDDGALRLPMTACTPAYEEVLGEFFGL